MVSTAGLTCRCVRDVRCAVCQVRDETAESVVIRETDEGWYWTAEIGRYQSWDGLAESCELAWAHATARLGANR